NYGLETVMQLRPVLYNWNYETDGTVKTLGFIAQEVEAVVPKLVSTDTEGMKSLNTTGIIPILTKSIQDLNLNLEGIAGITTPIPGSSTETFVNKFFTNLFSRVSSWLADTTNGITNVFANVFNAKEKICVDGECLTKDDVHSLLLLAHPSGSLTNQNTDSTPPTDQNAAVDPTPPTETPAADTQTPTDPAPPTDNTTSPPADTQTPAVDTPPSPESQ